MINEFLLYLKNANRSKRSIICYRGKLQIFFMEMEVPYSSLTSSNIQERLTKNQKDWKENTIRNYLDCLRSFFNFCVEKGYIENSPLRKRETNYWELKNPLPNAENQIIINEYLEFLKNENLSQKEIIKNRGRLQVLFNKKKDSFKLQTSEDTEKWIKERQGNLREHTIHDYLYYLRSFYHFCVEKAYIKENPIKYQRVKEVRYWEVKIPILNKENKEMINQYLLSINVANYSKFTVRSYRDILQNFFKERNEVYSSIASTEIQQWLIQLQKRCTEGTVSFRISVLNSFYRFCVEESYMEKSPMKSRWSPRLPQSIPKYLNKEEIAKVRKQNEKDNPRDRALVEFLLTSGCRVGEVHKLNLADVDLDRRTAMVIGKGQKIRQINFSVSCAVLLERYKESRNDQNPALFVTNHRNPRRLSSKWMGTVVRRIGKRAELSSNLNPHRFRHTFATNLLEKGAELSFIKDELGHSNLKTTQIYANLPNQQLKLLYSRYMG
ncbi:tyrosine-type recombinase/integrase [Psychrobacillus sp. PGGUH221]|uniref:tyrosine-type recombinase/integrase n=1 Tax=Psychrobacillus sp. PGGUH221 TaxID=3020058 RepID=UPI0035C6DB5A